MKIVSLLPSATEIVFELGLEGSLRGVTFECDHPAEASTYPHVSGTALPTDDSLTPTEIDAMVSELVQAGQPIYTLDDALIRTIDPDLILAQDLCQVCAVPSGAVQDTLEVIGCRSDVVSLDPHRLDDVIAGIGTVGAATGTEARPSSWPTCAGGSTTSANGWPAPPSARARARVGRPAVQRGSLGARHGRRRRRHRGAGRGRRPFAADHVEQVAAEPADVVVFMPCGFDLAGSVEQAQPLLDRPELVGIDRFFVVDANAYFSRPGPRVVDGVELLADLLHESNDQSRPGAVRLR